MKPRFTILIPIVFCLLAACKKTDPPPPAYTVPSPTSMRVESGNNQLGRANTTLPDTIVIAVTPKNEGDTKYYQYYFNNGFYGNGIITAYDTVIGGIYYIKAVWQLGNTNPPQTTILYLQANCASPNNTNFGCKPIDSVTISTKTSQPWVQVFANNPNVGGPGYFSDIHFTDAKNAVIVGSYYNTGLLQTSDSGNTWQPLSSARNDYYIASFSDADTGLVIVSNNYAYFTNDGGKTLYQPGTWTVPLIGDRSSSDYFMQSRDIIYTVGRTGGIAKTVDAGQTWSQYKGFNFINWLYSITCTDPNHCYACGEVGKVVSTNDAGATWSEYNAPFNYNLQKIYFWDKNLGFAAGDHGGLIRTTDGGNSWSIIKTKVNATLVCIRFVSADTGYLVTTNGDIEQTTDGGLTWTIVTYGNFNYYQGYNKIIFRDAKTIFALVGQSVYKFLLP